ncbi:MAG: nucleoside kinase [Eubacteriales bacterium]
MKAVTVLIGEKKIAVEHSTLIKELVGEIVHPYPIMGALVNNVLVDLNYCIQEDCIVDFVDMGSPLGIKIYEKSLLLILIRATQEVLPTQRLSVEHSLGGGIYCELEDKKLSKEELSRINKKIKEIIQKDLPINKINCTLEDAHQCVHCKRIPLLQYVPREKMVLYELDGMYEYFHGHMLPSTGYLDLFQLRLYYPGFILLYPSFLDPLHIPKFRDQKKLFQVFSSYEKWCNYFDIEDVASLNEKVKDGTIFDLIRVAEANHQQEINRIAEEIVQNRDRLKIILISGPSSAGKTTTSKRLKTNLMVHGIMPITIELDNYFLDRELTPRDENGEYDFENIDAIDIELFNDHLLKLMEYQEVEIPKFNFLVGKREKGTKIKIQENHPIIIEGIHGLNEKLTKYIPKDKKYKIYINALTHLNINAYNRIPTTDIRLIRRMVRDYNYRGHNGDTTLKMWGSVRAGEEKYIFPFQEEADYIFNSALFYELSALKKYAIPILKEVDPMSPYFPYANRIMEFLELFLSIEDESTILGNSILREFIGGSTC